jgi:hypothetical protein
VARIASQRFHGDRLTAPEYNEEDYHVVPPHRFASRRRAVRRARRLSGRGPAQRQGLLLLNWYVYSEHAPFFLGKERGYFDQEASTSTSRKAAGPA